MSNDGPGGGGKNGRGAGAGDHAGEPEPSHAGGPARAGAGVLTTVVTEIEEHAAGRGWEQPPRLYALVRTEELVRQEPSLARRLGIPASLDSTGITPVEQEPLPPDQPLDEVLSGIAWPDEVHGCALVVERLMLPPSVETEIPDDGDVARWAAQRPDREEVRLVVGVLRDGTRECALRLRSHDTSTEVLTGADLVPGLAEALAGTLLPA